MVTGLNWNHIKELSSLKSPPSDVLEVAGAVMLLLGGTKDWANFKSACKVPRDFLARLRDF